ncbi:MAG TPA: hypothetical protein VLG28_13985 [Acidimicrobiia bacterium]|jgi:hypothetical protein|nr:hypothetical protein [Acidimicrobiia bacterium]
MTNELPTPGQVSAEDRDIDIPATPAHRVAPTPGSIRCGSCHGPVLRFPDGSLRCVEEGVDLEAPATYLLSAD